MAVIADETQNASRTKVDPEASRLSRQRWLAGGMIAIALWLVLVVESTIYLQNSGTYTAFTFPSWCYVSEQFAGNIPFNIGTADGETFNSFVWAFRSALLWWKIVPSSAEPWSPSLLNLLTAWIPPTLVGSLVSGLVSSEDFRAKAAGMFVLPLVLQRYLCLTAAYWIQWLTGLLCLD